MQTTQKQSNEIAEVRKSRVMRIIDEETKRVNSLIDAYQVVKKLRPSFTREYLHSIGHAIAFLEAREEELAFFEANPDCPF